MQFNRAIILVVDGFGIGSTPDAGEFGDEGANTLAHLAQAYELDRHRPLSLPNLSRMGLTAALEQVSGAASAIEPVTGVTGA